ncbi:MAG: geranylgeranylglycerol-phosphate geranylgeranyltransferase [Pseudonocardiales bacterium]|jgi:4-hydroxybenzoate polyprenyltransferase/geranylgeranylglycerol-phosphate geranylgeranyltransferase|nr:geranylgeranylglycerol-phosphate geranylgeranyltransferase [Pseudonocardiales bacterium]
MSSTTPSRRSGASSRLRASRRPPRLRTSWLGIRLIAHLQTWRLYTLWYVGFVGLAGAGLSPGPHEGLRLFAAWAVPTLGWLGGHYLSDYFDRDLDAIAKPHRPIPSGRLPARTALACGVLAMLAVAVLAVLTGWRTSLIAVLAVAAVLAYGLKLKALGIAGNLVRGALGALALLYGAACAPPFAWAVLLPFVAAFWLHDTCSNLVGTLRDVDGDRAGGYRTLPVTHGTATGARVALGLYLLTLLAAGWGGLAAPASRHGWFLLGLAAVAAVGFAALLPLLGRRQSQAQLAAREALRAHELLVLERMCLAAAVIGLGLGMLPAVLLLIPALTLTWWSQRALRSWYEFGGTDQTSAPASVQAPVPVPPPADPPLDHPAGTAPPSLEKGSSYA